MKRNLSISIVFLLALIFSHFSFAQDSTGSTSIVNQDDKTTSDYANLGILDFEMTSTTVSKTEISSKINTFGLENEAFVNNSTKASAVFPKNTYVYPDAIQSTRDPENSSQRAKGKRISKWGLISGVATNSLNFTHSNLAYISKADYNNPTSYTIGFFNEKIFSSFNHKFSLYSEIIYTKFDFSGIYVGQVPENMTYQTTIDLSYIGWNGSTRYRFQAISIEWFLEFGFTMYTALGNSHYFTDENITGQSLTATNNTDEEISRFLGGLILGIGVYYNNSLFEFRYEKNDSVLDSSHFDTSISRFSFLVGYTLFYKYY